MKSRIVKCVLTIVVVSVFSASAYAEDIRLKKIIITPSRFEESQSASTRAVDVITSDEIALQSTKTVADVLSDITSLNISDYGALGATKNIRMRGATAAQVLVLVDGRPVNSPRDGEVDLNTIPLETIERIEVVHGPVSSLYGSQAMGGTINIVTKDPPAQKSHTEFTTSFGTFRTYAERLLQGGRIGDFGYLMTGGYEGSRGYRDNGEFRARDFNAKFNYAFGDKNTVTFSTGFYKSRAGTPGLVSAIDVDDEQGDLKNFADLTWESNPLHGLRLAAKVYQNYEQLSFMENTPGSLYDIPFDKYTHTTYARGLDMQAGMQFNKYYRALCGFNYVANGNDSTSSGKYRYIVRAGYFENQIDIIDALTINASVRSDDYSNFGRQTSPSASLRYAFDENNAIRASVSRSFRAPTFNDLYWPDEGWIKGNPKLEPEKGFTREIGFTSRLTPRLTSGITYYCSDFDNLINWVEKNFVWMPENIDSARIKGVECQNTIAVTDNLGCDVAYTFLKAQNESTRKYLIYQPKHKLDCALTYKGLGDLLIKLKGQFTNTRFHDADNNIKVKRFCVVGLDVSKRLTKQVTGYVSCTNVLGKNYQVIRDYPMPGFSVTGGMKVEF
jgi:outer membrane cobalamin receptor